MGRSSPAYLLYSLHIAPISKTYLGELQQFHSKCTRLTTKGYYGETAERDTNINIRRKYNIPTIGSRIKHID